MLMAMLFFQKNVNAIERNEITNTAPDATNAVTTVAASFKNFSWLAVVTTILDDMTRSAGRKSDGMARLP